MGASALDKHPIPSFSQCHLKPALSPSPLSRLLMGSFTPFFNIVSSKPPSGPRYFLPAPLHLIGPARDTPQLVHIRVTLEECGHIRAPLIQVPCISQVNLHLTFKIKMGGKMPDPQTLLPLLLAYQVYCGVRKRARLMILTFEHMMKLSGAKIDPRNQN